MHPVSHSVVYMEDTRACTLSLTPWCTWEGGKQLIFTLMIHNHIQTKLPILEMTQIQTSEGGYAIYIHAFGLVVVSSQSVKLQ